MNTYKFEMYNIITGKIIFYWKVKIVYGGEIQNITLIL